jgi:hypothetical protein
VTRWRKRVRALSGGAASPQRKAAVASLPQRRPCPGLSHGTSAVFPLTCAAEQCGPTKNAAGRGAARDRPGAPRLLHPPYRRMACAFWSASSRRRISIRVIPPRSEDRRIRAPRLASLHQRQYVGRGARSGEHPEREGTRHAAALRRWAAPCACSHFVSDSAKAGVTASTTLPARSSSRRRSQNGSNRPIADLWCSLVIGAIGENLRNL